MVGGLRKGCISLCGSSVRGAPFWGSGRIWGGWLRGRTSPRGGVRSPGTLRDSCKRPLEMGLPLSVGSLLGEPGGGGSFPMDPEGYERKALGMDVSLYGGSVGQTGVSSSAEDFEIRLKGSLEVQGLSLSLGAL